MNSFAYKHPYLCIYFVVTIVLVSFGVLSISGLSPIDNHRFINTIFVGKNFGSYVMPELGRLIPLTAQEYVLGAYLFHASPFVFQIISALKVLICGAVLGLSLSSFELSDSLKAALWSVAIFSVGFSNAAFRLHVGEINAFILILFFLWCYSKGDSKRNVSLSFFGFVSIALAFLYKELIVVGVLAFAICELFRYKFAKDMTPRVQLKLLLVVSSCYLAGYIVWRSINMQQSYANFHTQAIVELLANFSKNDPFIFFVVIPVLTIRLLIVRNQLSRFSFGDSCLISASVYAVAFIFLGIYNSYYLLPAYGFAIYGIAVNFSSFPKFGRHAVFLITIGAGVNNFPVAIADASFQKKVAENHSKFIQFLPGWIWSNHRTSGPTNLVLAGVSSGSGIEVLDSLKTFLISYGLKPSDFEIIPSEISDNSGISNFYKTKISGNYVALEGDLIVYNPFQKSNQPPPLMSPELREIFNSGDQWVLPQWSTLNWVQYCLLNGTSCSDRLRNERRFSGYTVSLKAATHGRQINLVQTPKFEIGPVLMPEVSAAGQEFSKEILIRNIGLESWPATGEVIPGKYVHLAYVWLRHDGVIALEGGRTALPAPMQSLDIAKALVSFKTPSIPGEYRLIISPLQEGVKWFYTENINAKAFKIKVL